MASFSIHLAIGNRYLEKNNVEDKKSFMNGIIAPDLASDKSISHYAKNQNRENAFNFFANKVFLVDYINSEYNDSDYQRGVFLHLATDYLFFNKFFDEKFLKNSNTNDFSSDIYYSYDMVNDYVNEKYKVDYSDCYEVLQNLINFKKKFIYSDKEKNNILPFDKLDEFIEYVSDIDLDKYKEKLLNNNTNVYP